MATKGGYEELRRKRIEENNKRMLQLGLFEHASFLKKKSKPATPRKNIKAHSPLAEVRRSARVAKIPSISYNETKVLHVWTSVLQKARSIVTEVRRSPRVAKIPSINYKEVKAETFLPEDSPRRGKGIGRTLRRGYYSPRVITEATLKAEEDETEHPSFVKSMLKSHVSGGFWLGLPHSFCATHFSKDDMFVLEDEDGLKWETIYLHHKHGLSGGWRGFSLDHDLKDGDALVFELVSSTKFRIQIKRLRSSKRNSKSYRYAKVENKENQELNLLRLSDSSHRELSGVSPGLSGQQIEWEA